MAKVKRSTHFQRVMETEGSRLSDEQATNSPTPRGPHIRRFHSLALRETDSGQLYHPIPRLSRTRCPARTGAWFIRPEKTTIQRHEFHSERGVSGYASASRSREGATPPERGRDRPYKGGDKWAAAQTDTRLGRRRISVLANRPTSRALSGSSVRAVGEYHIQPIYQRSSPVYDSAVSAGQSSVGVM
jgi:hypothetical protein